MSDFQDIQSLIRLKRHEQPPEDFVDDFMRAFHMRQRSEILNQSARGLLWERFNTYFEGLLTPKWGWGAATAMAMVGAFFLFKPGNDVSAGGQTIAENSPAIIQNGSVQAVSTNADSMAKPITDEEVRQYMLSPYRGGFELDGPPAIKTQRPHGILPAGFEQPMR